MKSILGAAAIGGAIGIGIDGASNRKGDHNYLGSFALGAAIGAGGVGILGSKSAVAAKPAKGAPASPVVTPSAPQPVVTPSAPQPVVTPSAPQPVVTPSAPQPVVTQTAPASPVVPQVVQTPTPVPSAPPAPAPAPVVAPPAPVVTQAPASPPLKATATQTPTVPSQPAPVIPAQPAQPKGPSAFAAAKNKLKTTGATIGQGLSSGGKTAWQKLNTNVPMPNMTLPQIPKIDLEPAKQWAKGKASAIQNSVGNGVSKISNSISSAGNSLKATGSSLNQKAGVALESVKRMTATARQYAARPINLKIPSVNVNLPKMPKGISSGISTALENGKKALPNYLKKGVFAIAVMAGSFASHGPSFNPVKPMIEHAQQTMSTSKFGSQAISEFMSDAKQMGSQVMDNITEAIPRALEHPKNTMKEAFGASAIKPMVENSAVGKYVELPNYSDEMARRIIINKKNNGDPFLVVDTSSKTITSYDSSANQLGRAKLVISENYTGNTATPQQLRELMVLQKIPDNREAISRFLKNNNIQIPRGTSIYTKAFDQKLSSEYIIDTGYIDKNYTFNRVAETDVRNSIGPNIHGSSSFAAENSKEFRSKILDKIKDSAFVAITDGKDYLGMSIDPMIDQNLTAARIVEKMKPKDPFLVADKKDNLIGMYSPDGKLIDYYPVGFGRDSKISDEFGIAKNSSMLKKYSNAEERQMAIDRNKLRSTPSGVFRMHKRTYGSEYAESGVGDTYTPGKTTTLVNSYNGDSPAVFSVHDVSFNQKNGLSQFANRNYNPLSPTLSSNGCIVVDDAVMQSKILPRLNENTIVAVMPNNGELEVGNGVYKNYKKPTTLDNLRTIAENYFYGPEKLRNTEYIGSNFTSKKPAFLQSTIADSARSFIDKPFKPGIEYRCADAVSSMIKDAIRRTGASESLFKHSLMAKSFSKYGQKIAPEDILPGDIITFTNTWRKSKSAEDATHVGIYTGNNMFSHRPSSEANAFRLSSRGAVVEENVSDWLKARKDKNVQIGGIYRIGK